MVFKIQGELDLHFDRTVVPEVDTSSYSKLDYLKLKNEGLIARVLLIETNFDIDWTNNCWNSHPLKGLLELEKSFLSPQATIMENKGPQDSTAKSSLGLLIVEGGFDDQVCVNPSDIKDRN